MIARIIKNPFAWVIFVYAYIGWAIFEILTKGVIQ